MKKLLSVALSLALLLSTLCCSVGFAAEEGIDPSLKGGPHADKDYSKEPQIEFSYAGVGMSSDVVTFSQNDPMISLIENKFNVRFKEVNNLGWGDWRETMRVWVNSGDAPDLMFYDVSYLELKDWAEQELISKIPYDGFAEKYPNLYSVIDASGANDTFVERLDGLYVLPHTIYSDPPTRPLVNHPSLTLRKDWLEKLGLEVKDRYTLDEVIAYGAAVHEATDLPGMVPGKTYGLDGTNLSNLTGLFFVCNPYYNTFKYDTEKGEYVWGAADPSTLDALKAMRKAWESGALHREFYVDTNRDPWNNIPQGLYGGTFDAGTPGVFLTGNSKFIAVEGNSPDNLIFAALLGNDGIAHNREIVNYWTGHVFGPKVSEEKMTRLLEMMDWMASDAGQRLVQLGLYGTDWKRDASGDIVITRAQNTDNSYIDLKVAYPTVDNFLSWFTNCQDGFDLINPAVPETMRNATLNIFRIKQEGEIIPLDWDLQLFSGTYYDKFALDYDSELSALAIEDGNLESNFNAWVDSKMPIIQNVLNELNANIKK